MAELSQKVKTSFDEVRLLLLVIQVFLGFQFRAPFEPLFEHLQRTPRALETANLVLLLAAFLMLVAPAPLTEIAYSGENSTAVQSFTTVMIGGSLAAFAIALAFNLFIAVGTTESSAVAVLIAGVFLAAAGWAWYGLAMRHRTAGPPRRNLTHRASVEDRTQHVLTEARMIVPGASALLGFQFATVLMEAFEKLPATLKRLHLLSLSLVTFSVIVLIAPAAYHRIAENGEESERVVDFATRAILASLVPLAFGIAIDTYVVLRAAGSSNPWALAVPASTIMAAGGLWFAYPIFRRRARARTHSSSPEE